MLLLAKYKISGHSMTPQIKDKEKVLVSGFFYLFKSPKVNDIAAFRYNTDVLIKEIREIKKEKYFLQGINEKDSLDSRKLGLILKKDILGKVFYKF